MTVYVDDMFKYPMGQFRCMKMSHMIADTDEELHLVAMLIGVERRWFQGDHYDISMTKRELAIQYGATPITLKQCAMMAALRRRGHEMGDPATAAERRMALRRKDGEQK